MFYPCLGDYGELIQSLTAGPIGHVCLKIDGCIYSTAKGRTAGWFLQDTFPSPLAAITIPCQPFPVSALDILPVGTPYPTVKTVLWWTALRIFPEPATCVRTCKDVLQLGGVTIKAHTPTELYYECLRKTSTM